MRVGQRPEGRVNSLPGPQKYVKQWPFGLFLVALGYYFTYFWGPVREWPFGLFVVALGSYFTYTFGVQVAWTPQHGRHEMLGMLAVHLWLSSGSFSGVHTSCSHHAYDVCEVAEFQRSPS